MFAFLEFGSCLRVFLCLKRGAAGGGETKKCRAKTQGLLL